MKYRKSIYIAIFLIGAVLFSSCSGSGSIGNSSWPGTSANGDTLYLSNSTAVYAIRMADGNLTWKFPAEAKNTTHFYAPVYSSGDQLIVGDYLNTLYSINPQTGAQNWTFTEATGRYIGGVLVTEDQILAPVSNSNLYALSTSGQKQWVFEDSTQALWAQPVSDGSLIYQASMDHHVYAVDPGTGEQAWNLELDGAVVYAPLLDDGTLYATTLSGTVYAINTDDHQILWQSAIDSGGWGSPVMNEGTLYLGDLSGKIYAVNSVDGSQLWKVEAGGPVVGCGNLTPDGVVFVTETGDVVLVGFDGIKKWTRSIEGKLYGRPAIGDDRIVVSVLNGENLLVAYDFSGNEVWTFVPAK